MGFSFQIRIQGKLMIPKDAGFVPPIPACPNAISLSAKDVDTVVAFMRAAGAVDASIDSSKKKKRCRPRTVPVYKFLTNDGYVVTAKEAGLIADRMAAQNLFAPEFLKTHWPKIDFDRPDIDQALERPRQLVALWQAFNRVAEANNGYTIK